MVSVWGSRPGTAGREDARTRSLGESKSRNKVSVGEPAEGSLSVCCCAAFRNNNNNNTHKKNSSVFFSVWCSVFLLSLFLPPHSWSSGRGLRNPTKKTLVFKAGSQRWRSHEAGPLVSWPTRVAPCVGVPACCAALGGGLDFTKKQK